MRYAAGAVLLVTLALAAPASAGGHSRTARIDHVVDGDTLALRNGERVRLIGIDTPEVNSPEFGDECFGVRASRFVEGLLDEGDRIRLVFDADRRDQYDRLLAYVYRSSDRLFLNAELLEQGYATVLTVSPNRAHVEEFERLERKALEHGRGLWAACLG